MAGGRADEGGKKARGKRGKNLRRNSRDWNAALVPIPGTCTSGNSPTAKWICDKVTATRTRNSDKEPPLPSAFLRSLSLSRENDIFEKTARDKEGKGYRAGSWKRTRRKRGNEVEWNKWRRSEKDRHAKETRADNVRVMVASGYFYIPVALLKANVRDNASVPPLY